MPATAWKFDEAEHPRDAKGQFVTLYHGTRERDVESILREGLKPGKEGLVWATESREEAQRFAEGLDYPQPTSGATVVTIRAPRSAFFFEKPLTPGRKNPVGTRTARFAGRVRPEWVARKWDPNQPRDKKGQWAKVGERIAALKAKYPVVAQNYVRSTHTEMGSIESHTKDVGREWETQLTHEQLAGISERFGSDVGKLMASAIPLHDIGKAEAIEVGGAKERQHEYTVPILQGVLRQEGFSEKDITLATELLNHDLIGPLFRGYEGFSAKEADVVTKLKDKAKKVGMDVSDFVTLQLAFYQADAAAYPYITQYMQQEPSGKWTFSGNKKIAAIEALVKKVDKQFVNVLRWDEALHPRDATGQFSETRGDRSPHEQKRRDFMALVKRHGREDVIMERLRVGVLAKWQAWSEDLSKGRKKPLKADGAAAKKLPSYKEAKALEETFHARFETVRRKKQALAEQAKALLKVPVADRSDVEFFDDAQNPITVELRKQHAQQILRNFRQFDGSGSLVSSRYTAEQVEQISKLGPVQSEVFLKALRKNPDGSFSLPSKIRLSQSDSPRAHADGIGIYLGSGRELEATVNHEVGHHIEMRNGAVLKAAIALREKLANQPREVYKLKTVSPALGDDEEALRGKFPDPYAAKLYPKDGATEMTSTGIESYLKDPLTFARDREEHFNLIFDIMQGKYRS